jgi:hypothetical protein
MEYEQCHGHMDQIGEKVSAEKEDINQQKNRTQNQHSRFPRHPENGVEKAFFRSSGSEQKHKKLLVIYWRNRS